MSEFKSEFKIEIPLIPVVADVGYLFGRIRDENHRLTADSEMQSRNSNGYLFLRNEENKICGGAVAEFRFDLVYIDVIWIAPEFRNQGHATRLYRALEDLAYIKKKRRALISTFYFQRASGFWEKLGFESIGEVPADHLDHTLVYMYKKISSEDR